MICTRILYWMANTFIFHLVSATLHIYAALNTETQLHIHTHARATTTVDIHKSHTFSVFFRSFLLASTRGPKTKQTVVFEDFQSHCIRTEWADCAYLYNVTYVKVSELTDYVCVLTRASQLT